MVVLGQLLLLPAVDLAALEVAGRLEVLFQPAPQRKALALPVHQHLLAVVGALLSPLVVEEVVAVAVAVEVLPVVAATREIPAVPQTPLRLTA